MKKILFILLMFPAVLFAQNYSGQVKVPGKSAAYLYTKAREWFTENHKSVDNTPFTEDVANGKLKGNGQFSFVVYSNELTMNVTTYYIVMVTVKDGLYSYAFDNVMVEHGRKFPLSTFKDGMTREGTLELFKNGGLKLPGKKMVDTNVEYSKKVVNECDGNFERLTASLEDKMKE